MPRWISALMWAALVATASLGCTTTPKNIDPRADAMLRRMSDTLAAGRSFELHTMATMERRMESGQLAQVSRDSTIAVSRPDRLWAEVHQGADVRRIWHQGKEQVEATESMEALRRSRSS